MKTVSSSAGATVLRWMLALVLIWAALGKIANPHEFHTAILAYRIPLPEVLSRTAAIIIPWLELLCGLILAANFRRHAALFWAFALFASFTIITGQAWARGLQIHCGCFDLRILGLTKDSSISTALESPLFAVIRAAVLATLAFFLIRREARGER
jgi:putative oxidoreductase